MLKDRKLDHLSFGEIFLETQLIYNPARATIKTLLPPEENLLYEEPKFKRNLFMQVQFNGCPAGGEENAGLRVFRVLCMLNRFGIKGVSELVQSIRVFQRLQYQ